MKIAVIGMGYVGCSIAVLLSQKNDVIALDVDEKKVELINAKKSPIKDNEIESYLKNKELNLKATLDKEQVYKNSEYVIIATPTNYDVTTGSFDTSSVESVIKEAIDFNENTNIVIKSTIPIGFTDRVRNQFKNKNIFFSPEFLREGKALYDNLYPSRIVVGDKSENAIKFAKILADCSKLNNKEVKIHFMESKEAEAVKLFSNTYLAMRIAFFNELDTFAEVHEVSAEKIISAVSDDSRIGSYYNNPSFGYGGYCLPKDTKQLLDNYNKIPNNLIKAVIDSNTTRKEFVAQSVMKKYPKSVGIYRLSMKVDSDNFRESAVLDIIDIFKKHGIKVNLYEPYLDQLDLSSVSLINNLEEFILSSDIILANRISHDLDHVQNKVYSRDIFRNN